MLRNPAEEVQLGGAQHNGDEPVVQREQDQLVDDKIQPLTSTPSAAMTGFQYLQRRMYGSVNVDLSALYAGIVAKHLPSTLVEQEFKLGTMNKVFAAKWLNDKQVVFGTKCNQVGSFISHCRTLCLLIVIYCIRGPVYNTIVLLLVSTT